MDHGQHCRLCVNRIYDISSGTTCAVTGEKPDFQGSCDKISFDDKLKDMIEDVNIELEEVLQTKSNSILNFWLFLILAIAVIGSGYLYGSLTADAGVISTVPIVIMGAGLLLFPMAFGPMNKYRAKFNVATRKKDQLDSILMLYGLKYDIEINTRKDVHGNKEFDADIKFEKNL